MARSPACARNRLGRPDRAALDLLFAGSSALAGHLSDWTHDHRDAGARLGRAVSPVSTTSSARDAVTRPTTRDRGGRTRTPIRSGPGSTSTTTRTSRETLASTSGTTSMPRIATGPCTRGSAATTAGSSRGRRRGGPLVGSRDRHAWERNPRYQTYWNGRGIDGTNYGTYIPDVWRGGFPGHRFFWGLAGTRRRIP